MNGMFSECSSLVSINLTGFETSNVVDMYCMFSDCSSLSYIDLTGVNIINVKSYQGIFDGVNEEGTIVFNRELMKDEIFDLFPQNWEYIEKN